LILEDKILNESDDEYKFKNLHKIAGKHRQAEIYPKFKSPYIDL
jgi:hypothetical protein